MVPKREGGSRLDPAAVTGGGRDSERRPKSGADEFIGETEITKDAVFELLTSSRRRAIIQHLNSTGAETTRGELAVELAAAELGLDPAEVSSQQRKRLYISLYQVHLPRLAGEGVIEYDEDRGTVSLAEPAELLLPYINLDPTEDRHTGQRSSLVTRLKGYLGD